MFLNQHLLEKCEEIFELITNDSANDELDFAIDSLRHFLEKDVDGFTSHNDEALAYAVQSRLAAIWNMISDEEKEENSLIEELYMEAMAELEEESGYEADDLE